MTYEIRVSLFQALTDDERQEWRDLEEGDAHYTTIPARLREARLTGAGLTEQPDGTNPYRAFLRQRSEGMAEMLERIESMRLERERATT